MNTTRLRQIAEAYLDALVRRDTSRLAFAPGFRASVNGAWIEAQALPQIDDFPALQMFVDEQQGGVALVGAARVSGALLPYALRLKIDSDHILESEAIVSSTPKGHFADVDQLLKPDVLYDAPVPQHRASDREGLRAAADSYWSGLQESDGSIPKFAYRCDRFDNGKKITNNLSILLSPEATVLTCASGLYTTRPARPMARNRRFPVLDVEIGVAVSFVMVEFGPNTLLGFPGMVHYMMGLFKVVDGEIRSLDEITQKLPAGTAAIW